MRPVVRNSKGPDDVRSSLVLAKWIVCCVETQLRGAFDRAQRAWSRLASAPGFIAQCGGWDDRGDAAILSLWGDSNRYRSFMAPAGLHDDITRQNSQDKTYSSSSVLVCPEGDWIRGTESDLSAAIGGAGMMRAARCTLRPQRAEHFLEAQRTIWNPAMAALPGFLGALLALPDAPAREHLVLAFWSSTEAEGDFAVRGAVRGAALRAEAHTDDDVESFEIRHVMLLPEWTVLPATGEPAR